MDIVDKMSRICIKFVAKNLQKTEEELEKIKYGVHVILVNLVKLTILFLIASILGITTYTFIAVISFASIRIFASGVHAESNLNCTITNIILFLGNVYLSINILLDKTMIIVIITLSLILVFLYAPADTKARPLVSKKLRKKLRIYSIAITFLLGIIALTCKNNIFANLIIFSVLEESLLITPLIYYILNKTYKNYENINI
ncbi:accessory gene regulator B family protein [Clostridium pasteurianum]|uniref:Putative AgrB-like protein n=1 Tax=Clostridium pasteurianum BC1 TaxID=86416 RepID=R4K0E4_CLOPA|nr:accessory gene regulator B family protein [Clostridium pasteurianum]AGK96013.1 hypothetical protein Clopa_1002 [Clostridium pasteurianum BC1]